MTSAAAVRGYRPGDRRRLVRLLEHAFAGLEYVPRVKADLDSVFHPEGFFLAEESGAAVGCIYVLDLPRRDWHEIRHLALRDAPSRIGVGRALLERAIARADSVGSDYLKAMTLAVPPYVELFQGFDFRPVRRTLRFSWDLTRDVGRRRRGRRPPRFRELGEADRDELADLFVEGHLPYWDWWVEERGGKGMAGDWLRTLAIAPGTWVAAIVGGEVAGYVGYAPDFYGRREARLRTFCVLPEFRGKGIGAALLAEVLRKAKRRGQVKLVIYTVAHLDGLAPGAIAYLKSGAKIEAEYLQLLRE